MNKKIGHGTGGMQNILDNSIKERFDFASRVEDKSLKIAVVGLGYVGLPLLIRLRELGFPVIGLDNSISRVETLGRGISPIRHIPHKALEGLVGEGCKLTTDFAEINSADAIIVCVPTPLTQNQTPDMSFVKGAAIQIGEFARPEQLIVLESTVYPGATEEYFLPPLLNKNLQPGVDIFLAYSPEREDPGNKTFSAKNTPKLCGGYTELCLQRALALYSKVTSEVVAVTSMQTAEMAKLLENIHRCVNIGLVNEMKVVADKMGIDIHEVISAAATKPFGFTAFWPGPGLGGHCIPIDPFYMTWRAKEYGIDTKFIEIAGQVNSSMPLFVVEKIMKALNDKSKPIRGRNILIYGLAYKKNIDDIRESPSLAIANELIELGANVYFEDKLITNQHSHEIPEGLMRFDAEGSALSEFDCLVIATDHDYFDYNAIRDSEIPVVDTRGRYRVPFDGLYRA